MLMNLEIPARQDAAEASEVWLPAPQLCKRHGISQMSLWRRMRDPKLNFPQPIIVSGRRYFRLTEIQAWESAMRSKVA